MKKFNYLILTSTKKIRYLKHIQKNADYIVFLHGFMSDLEGKKPKTFLEFAKKNRLGFLALEYSGHGKSTGKFTNGNISKWSKETNLLIKRIVKKNKIILIGSSMGAWISLNQFKYFKNQIKGFLGIGSAPEFLERLMWKQFTKKTKKEIKQKGISIIKHGQSKFKQKEYEYPVTYQLIKDGRKNKILSKKITSVIPVTMVHGKKDELVPVSFSKKVLSIFTNAKKKIVVIKNGDHSLSNKNPLKKIIKELNEIVMNVV